MRRTPRSFSSLAVALAALTGLSSTATSATAAVHAPAGATTGASDEAAAGWLARQLTGARHDHLVTTYGVDPGLTADAVLSMAAAGVAQRAATRATDWLARHARSYAAEANAADGYNPGKLAKLLLVAEAEHRDLHAFGGLDLPALLRGSEQSDGAYADTANGSAGISTFGQSLALIALSGTGALRDWPDAAAIGWLTDQQCGDGSFQYTVASTPPATCADVDTTGVATQALLTVRSSRAAAATGWLRAHRNPDGGYGFAFGSTDPASNANSTAVAIQALRQAGYRAARALTWLRQRQIRCTGEADRRGAVRSDATRPYQYDATTVVYATAQAGQALAGQWLAGIDGAGARAAAPTFRCS